MQEMLRQQPLLADDDITVRLNDDTIVLEGAVDSHGERDLAMVLVHRHKPARLHVSSRLTVPPSADQGQAPAELRRLTALARFTRARSHAPELHLLADRVLADAALAERLIGAVPTAAGPPAVPDPEILEELDGQSLNLVLLRRLTSQLAAAAAALRRLDQPGADIESAARELLRDREQAQQLQSLFQPAVMPRTRRLPERPGSRRLGHRPQSAVARLHLGGMPRISPLQRKIHGRR
jgi:hypothetical protein